MTSFLAGGRIEVGLFLRLVPRWRGLYRQPGSAGRAGGGGLAIDEPRIWSKTKIPTPAPKYPRKACFLFFFEGRTTDVGRVVTGVPQVGQDRSRSVVPQLPQNICTTLLSANPYDSILGEALATSLRPNSPSHIPLIGFVRPRFRCRRAESPGPARNPISGPTN